MDKAQLKLYGTVQLVNANFIGDHPEYRQAEFRCPVCFERVHWILRETATMQSQYFAHGKQQNAVPGRDICELRTKGIPGFASYIKARLPLYLTQTFGVFQLNLGLPGLDDRVLELAQSLNLGLEIKAANQIPLELKQIKQNFADGSLQPSSQRQVTYENIQVASISSEKFRPWQRTLIPLNFIPRFDYSSKQQQELADIHLRLVSYHPQLPEILSNRESADFVKNLVDVIHDEWSILVDGFGPHGAFFHYGSQMGRQVKRGSILVPGVKYFLVTPEDYKLPDFIRVIDTHNTSSFENSLGKLHLREIWAKSDSDDSTNFVGSTGRADATKHTNATSHVGADSHAKFHAKSQASGEKLSAAQKAWQAAIAQTSMVSAETQWETTNEVEASHQPHSQSHALQAQAIIYQAQVQSKAQAKTQAGIVEPDLSQGSVQIYRESQSGKKVFSAQAQHPKQEAVMSTHFVTLVVRSVFISAQDYKERAAEIEHRLNKDFCLYVDTPVTIKPLWPPVINHEAITPVKNTDKVFCAVKGTAFQPEVYRNFSAKQSEALRLEPVACNPQAQPSSSKVKLFNQGTNINFTLCVPLGCDLKRQQILQKQYAKLKRLSLPEYTASAAISKNVNSQKAVNVPGMMSTPRVVASKALDIPKTVVAPKAADMPVGTDQSELNSLRADNDTQAIDWSVYPTSISWGIGENLTFQNAKVEHIPLAYELSFTNAVQQHMGLPWRTLSNALHSMVITGETAPALTSLKPAAEGNELINAQAQGNAHAKVTTQAKGNIQAHIHAKYEVESQSAFTDDKHAPAKLEKRAVPQYLANFMASLSGKLGSHQASAKMSSGQPVSQTKVSTLALAQTPASAPDQAAAAVLTQACSLVPDLQAMSSLAQKIEPELWCCELKDYNFMGMITSTILQVVTLDAQAQVLENRRLLPNFKYSMLRDEGVSQPISSMWVVGHTSRYRNDASILFAASCPPIPVPAFNWTGQPLSDQPGLEQFEAQADTAQFENAGLTEPVVGAQTATLADPQAEPYAGSQAEPVAAESGAEPIAAGPVVEAETDADPQALSQGGATTLLTEKPFTETPLTDEWGLTNDLAQNTDNYKFDANALLQKWGPGAVASVGFALGDRLGVDAETQALIEHYPFEQSSEEINLERKWFNQFWSSHSSQKLLILAPAWVREVILRCRERHWFSLAWLLEQTVSSGKLDSTYVQQLWNLRQYLMGSQDFKSALGLVELEHSLDNDALDEASAPKPIYFAKRSHDRPDTSGLSIHKDLSSHQGLSVHQDLSSSQDLLSSKNSPISHSQYSSSDHAGTQKLEPKADTSGGLAQGNHLGVGDQVGVKAETQVLIEHYPFDLSSEELKLKKQRFYRFWPFHLTETQLIMAPAWLRDFILDSRNRWWLPLLKLLEEMVSSGKLDSKYVQPLRNLRQYLMTSQTLKTEKYLKNKLRQS